MPLMELTKDNFDKTIAENELIIIDFWAQWCQPCLMFAEVFERCAQDYPDIIFGKINVETEADLAQDFNVRSIPMLMVIRQSIALFSESGTMPEAALRDLIEQAKAVDMDSLKATLVQGDQAQD